jgi:hypothetical protein
MSRTDHGRNLLWSILAPAAGVVQPGDTNRVALVQPRYSGAQRRDHPRALMAGDEGQDRLRRDVHRLPESRDGRCGADEPAKTHPSPPHHTCSQHSSFVTLTQDLEIETSASRSSSDCASGSANLVVEV